MSSTPVGHGQRDEHDAVDGRGQEAARTERPVTDERPAAENAVDELSGTEPPVDESPADERGDGERDDGEPAGRPSQRARQKARTRRRLLIAATREFVENGPTTASLDAIAKRAGVSRPTLFFHFGSRDELMNEVGLYLLDRFWSVTRRHPASDFRSYLEAYILSQRSRLSRLVWHLGDLALQGRLVPQRADRGAQRVLAEDPEGPQTGYWNLVAELERYLVAAGHEQGDAHERAVVLAPAANMVARRVAQDLASEAEVKDFIDAACRLALGSTGPSVQRRPSASGEES